MPMPTSYTAIPRQYQCITKFIQISTSYITIPVHYQCNTNAIPKSYKCQHPFTAISNAITVQYQNHTNANILHCNTSAIQVQYHTSRSITLHGNALKCLRRALDILDMQCCLFSSRNCFCNVV